MTEANSINASTTGIVGNTGTAFTGTAVTQYNVIVGGSTSSTLSNVSPSATSGVPLISQGAAADPIFSTALVAGGGTGETSFTAYSVICGGTTSTGNLQNVSGVGSSGNVLTSNGASALPTWQAPAASGISTIDGDSGSITGSTVTIYANNASQNCGSSVLFSNSSATSTLNVTDASANTLIGLSSGNGSLSGSFNTALGKNTLLQLTSGSSNVAVGLNSLTALQSGTGNICIGNSSCANLTTGSSNTAIGASAGNSLATSDSSNIMLKNSGVGGDNNTIRIGTQGSGSGQQNLCYVAGIVGVTVSNTNYVTIDSTTGQLGVITSLPNPFTWSDKSTAFNALKNNGYFISGSCTATLPASPSNGDTIEFFVDGAFTLTIQANTGQTIQFATSVSSSAGTQANTASGDACTLVYRSTDTKWCALEFVGAWNAT